MEVKTHAEMSGVMPSSAFLFNQLCSCVGQRMRLTQAVCKQRFLEETVGTDEVTISGS